MRPVNQLPLSEMAMKRSPLASSRRPDRPPKPRKRDVSTNPLRNSSAPNRTRARSRVSKPAIGRALTSIETGSVTEYSSGFVRFGGGCTAVCASACFGSACARNPAAVAVSKRRRLHMGIMGSGMQTPPPSGRRLRRVGLAEQFGELFGDRAAELFGVDDSHRSAIIARHVVADADRDQLDRRAGFDFLDDMTEVTFQIIAG